MVREDELREVRGDVSGIREARKGRSRGSAPRGGFGAHAKQERDWAGGGGTSDDHERVLG